MAQLNDDLLLAASSGKVPNLAQLLRSGADANSRTSAGQPALSLAVQARSVECAQQLICHGAEVDGQGVMGNTALHLAVELRHIAMIELLVRSGAGSLIVNDSGLSPLQVACLRDAPHELAVLLHSLKHIGHDDADEVDLVQLTGDEELAAMFAAVAKGSVECFRRLLHLLPALAQYRKHAAVVAGGELTDRGTTLLQDRQRGLLSSTVVGHDQLRTLCFLLQTASCPGHVAAGLGRSECLELLLRTEALAASDTNLEGWTPLLYGASSGHVDCIQVLLAHGADLEHRNRQGRTAVFLAAISGQPEALGALIKAGAQVDSQESARLYTPLVATTARASMMEAKGDPQAERFMQCMALLVAAGAGVDIPSRDGSTALHTAAENGAPTCLAMLLKGGANVNNADGQGRAPIVGAAARGHASCVLQLIAGGATITAGLASSVMECLAQEPMSMWTLLVLLTPQQLPALSSSPAFYQLPVGEAPTDGLPESLLATLLQGAFEGMNDLLYNVLRADQAHVGRRPAYLLELIRKGWPSTPSLQASLAVDARMVKAVQLWQSTQPLLQYAAYIARCAMVPAGDKEKLSSRVGHLLSAYHQLATLCRHANLTFACGAHQETGTACLLPLLDLTKDATGDTHAPAPAAGHLPPGQQQQQLCLQEGLLQLDGPYQEPTIASALQAYSGAVESLVDNAKQGSALAGWHFLLEYPQIAQLPTKQRLLQSLIMSWERRGDSQLRVSTGRLGVLQAFCSIVDDHRGNAGPTGAALWHGIKVAFTDENGVGDGVRRDWFSLLAAELTNPDAGLFETHNDGLSYQPAPHAHVHCDEGMDTGHLAKFELVGSVLGVALMQGCTVPGFNLSPHVWKLVLAGPQHVDLTQDLAAADAQLAQGLAGLGQLGATGLQELGLHFQMHDALGNTIDLVAGGSDIAVTWSNLEQYIVELARYKLVASIEREAAAIGRGLRSIVTASVLDCMGRCLTASELNIMLAGQHHICTQQWEAHTSYANCSGATPLVRWFWGIVGELAQPELAALLGFVTGSSTLPAGGFAALQGFNGAAHPFTLALVIVEGDDRLPRASTCFNTLYLPNYSSPTVLRQRLRMATAGGSVFDEGVITR